MLHSKARGRNDAVINKCDFLSCAWGRNARFPLYKDLFRLMLSICFTSATDKVLQFKFDLFMFCLRLPLSRQFHRLNIAIQYTDMDRYTYALTATVTGFYKMAHTTRRVSPPTQPHRPPTPQGVPQSRKAAYGQPSKAPPCKYIGAS